MEVREKPYLKILCPDEKMLRTSKLRKLAYIRIKNEYQKFSPEYKMKLLKRFYDSIPKNELIFGSTDETKEEKINRLSSIGKNKIIITPSKVRVFASN